MPLCPGSPRAPRGCALPSRLPVCLSAGWHGCHLSRAPCMSWSHPRCPDALGWLGRATPPFSRLRFRPRPLGTQWSIPFRSNALSPPSPPGARQAGHVAARRAVRPALLGDPRPPRAGAGRGMDSPLGAAASGPGQAGVPWPPPTSGFGGRGPVGSETCERLVRGVTRCHAASRSIARWPGGWEREGARPTLFLAASEAFLPSQAQPRLVK